MFALFHNTAIPDKLEQQYGIGVPNGEVAKTAEEAEAIAKQIGMSWGRSWFDGCC